MNNPKIRAHYAELTEIANGFKDAANHTQTTLRQLHEQVTVLQAGDWVGVGATTFYQEMQAEVGPALKRLGAALETAAHTTQAIREIMEQAEADAARQLKGQGGHGAAALAAIGGTPFTVAAPLPIGDTPTFATQTEGGVSFGTKVDYAQIEGLINKEHQLRAELALMDHQTPAVDRQEVKQALAEVVQQQEALLAAYLDIPTTTAEREALLKNLPASITTSIMSGGKRLINRNEKDELIAPPVLISIPAEKLTRTTLTALVNQFMSYYDSAPDAQNNPRYAPLFNPGETVPYMTFCDVFIRDVLAAAQIDLVWRDKGRGGITYLQTEIEANANFHVVSAAQAQAWANAGAIVIAIQPQKHGAVVVPSDARYDPALGPQIAQSGWTPAMIGDNTFVVGVNENGNETGGFGNVDPDADVIYYVYRPTATADAEQSVE